jgi:sugar lactone lactonase YvrE
MAGDLVYTTTLGNGPFLCYYIATTAADSSGNPNINVAPNLGSSAPANLSSYWYALNPACAVNSSIYPQAQVIATGFNWPQGLAIDLTGNIYVADGGANSSPPDAVYKITAPASTNAPYQKSLFYSVPNPTHVLFDRQGNLLISAYLYGQILRMDPSGVVSTFASGIYDPEQFVFDSSGNIFIASNWSGTIEKVTPSGNVSYFANSGIYYLGGMAIDSSGNLFASGCVGGSNCGTISKITPSGIVTTFSSGNPYLSDLALDAGGNLYAAAGNSILVFSPTGQVSTLNAGTAFVNVSGMVFDSTYRNLYVTDSGQHAVYKIQLR